MSIVAPWVLAPGHRGGARTHSLLTVALCPLTIHAPQHSLSCVPLAQMAAGRCVHCGEDMGTHAAVLGHMKQEKHFMLPKDSAVVRSYQATVAVRRGSCIGGGGRRTGSRGRGQSDTLSDATNQVNLRPRTTPAPAQAPPITPPPQHRSTRALPAPRACSPL